MRLNKLSTIIILILTPSISSAFFCPSNFNQIDFGSTMDQVTQQCGKPDSQTEFKKADEHVAQEWNYYIPQTVSTYSMGAVQGTLKTQFTFDSDGKSINISVNGIAVGSTTICGNAVQLGDTRDTVKSACGDPSFINKQNNTTNNGLTGNSHTDQIKVTVFIYNTNPPVKLIFENGALKEKQ